MNPPLFPDFTDRITAGESLVDLALSALSQAKATTGCFVSFLTEDQVKTAAMDVEKRLAAGEKLPLAGIPFCVKDNIDVAGLPSTSNCPGYGQIPTKSAPTVTKAVDAGAILIGKNTMDQFATGLNGTRSPEPLCQNVLDPKVIPGGSSSGSAVAVAMGICGFSLGSDTGGSGRVPAAANGIVGFKPTPGSLSGRGLVYCNRSFDVVPIFTKTIAEAHAVYDIIGGPDPDDPYAYWGGESGFFRDDAKIFAIPSDVSHFGDDAAAQAHEQNLVALEEAGYAFKVIDFSPFARVGQKVFGSALVAERLIDYGDFIAENPDKVVGPVSTAINNGRTYSAQDLYATLHEIAEQKVICQKALKGTAGLLLPTIPRLYTVKEMQDNPMELNNVMGTYTYFANPIGFSALAFPGVKRSDGIPSSLCLYGPEGSDRWVLKTSEMLASTLKNGCN